MGLRFRTVFAAVPAAAAVCALAVAATVLPLTPAARAAVDTPSEQYLSLRRVNPPRAGLTLRTIAASEDPYRYAGTLIELEGRLTGLVARDEGATLLFSTRDGLDITPEMSLLPAWVHSGDELRILAVVVPPEPGTVAGGIPDLKVVAVASASDIAAAEMRARQTAASRAARDRQTQAALRAAEAALNAPAGRHRTAASRASTQLASRGAETVIRPGTSLFGYLSPSARDAYPHYLRYVKQCNRRLSDEQADAIASSILLFSERYAVDPRLMVALIIAESDFKPKETSNKGAMGLGQLMPDEAQTLGLSNPYDPVQNIAGAVYLMRGRLDKYSGGSDLTMQDIILALASYNAGMGAVKKYGGVPPYRETQNYVKKIERIYRQLCGAPAA